MTSARTAQASHSCASTDRQTQPLGLHRCLTQNDADEEVPAKVSRGGGGGGASTAHHHQIPSHGVCSRHQVGAVTCGGDDGKSPNASSPLAARCWLRSPSHCSAGWYCACWQSRSHHRDTRSPARLQQGARHGFIASCAALRCSTCLQNVLGCVYQGMGGRAPSAPRRIQSMPSCTSCSLGRHCSLPLTLVAGYPREIKVKPCLSSEAMQTIQAAVEKPSARSEL